MLMGAWIIKDMGDAGRLQGTMNDIVVAALRPGDSTIRVYAANSNTQIFEFTYNSTANKWDKVSIGTVNGQAINAITVGNGRNDGIKRLYAATRDAHVYELTPTTGTWSCLDLGVAGSGSNSGMLGVTLGNGRNDGYGNRVYAAADNYHLYEYTYSAGVWSILDMGTGFSNGAMNKIAIGACRPAPDVNNRVYVANNDSSLYEFNWDVATSSWTGYGMGLNGSYMRDVVIGNGRNDGVNSVYAANANGRPYEYVYSAVLSTWTYFCVDNATLTNSNGWIERITISSGIEDGSMRLYGADHDNSIYEYSFGPDYAPSFPSYLIGSSTFTKTDIGSATSPMQAIAAGNGRNDGMIRLYAGSSNYHLYEFTYSTSTLLSEIQSNNNIANGIVYPTFVNLSKGVKMNFANFTPNAELTIITLAGHTIKKLHADANGYINPWDGTIEGGGKAASGTYIVHAADNSGNFKVFKILLIK
jgi:hypothetical protein